MGNKQDEKARNTFQLFSGFSRSWHIRCNAYGFGDPERRISFRLISGLQTLGFGGPL